MPLPDLPDDERAELVRLVRDAIADNCFFLSARARRLRRILGKIEPPPMEKPTVTPNPGAETER